jgi:hypothetical protein
MSWRVEGQDDFTQFAEDIRTVRQRVPEIIESALEETSEEYISRLTKRIRSASTAKGGTFDSRTSRYDAGTSNDSSDDNLHISEQSAWTYNVAGPSFAIIQPKEAVEDRALWMEEGTQDHGPTGDKALHFFVGGDHVVMIDWTDKSDLPASGINEMLQAEDSTEKKEILREYSENLEVSGVEQQNFFKTTAINLQNENIFSKNLKKHYGRVLDQEIGGI